MSRKGSFDTIPRGSQPPTIAVARWLRGPRRLFATSFHEPGTIGSAPRRIPKTAPAERSARSAGRPSASLSPWKVSPAEWATMNHGGTPEASSEPIIAPAEVPTT